MDIRMEELSSDFLRSTELAAVMAARTRGRDDKAASDRAATQEMRRRLGKIRMKGTVRIGEGELDGCDESSMLYRGERIGLGWQESYAGIECPEVDIAVDPLEGTNLCARGEPNAICVAAFTPAGGMVSVPEVYMEKLVVGPAARGQIDLNASVRANLDQIARSLNRSVGELTIMVLDRPRHATLIAEIRKADAEVALIRDGDLSAGLLAQLGGSGIAAAWGIGGGPEGVLVAALAEILGGEIQGRFLTKEMLEDPDDRAVIPDDVAEQLRQSGIADPTRILTTSDLVTATEIVFCAAAVTNSELLQGVRFFSDHGSRVQSLKMGINRNTRWLRKSDSTEVARNSAHVFRVDRD